MAHECNATLDAPRVQSEFALASIRRRGVRISMTVSVISDAAAKAAHDLLAFDRYLDPLVDILTNPKTETPLTIGVFGAWGSGKSTLLGMLDERLKSDHEDDFVRVDFNPWVHRNEPDMLIPLLHALRDRLESDRTHRFVEAATAIGNAVVKLGGDILLRRVTANALSLEKVDELRAEYARQRGEVESEIRNLRAMLQEHVDNVWDKGNGARLVIFIDDLDRCQPTEIIDVLEMTKLFFDLRHTFIVIAVDKDVIDRGIEVKYNDFSFAEGRQAAIGAEYLEKMVQLPLNLFPLRESQVRAFVERLNPGDAVEEQLDLMQELLLPNPRKIKRIVNMLAVTTAIADSIPELADLDRGLLTRLAVMQVQSPELYGEIVRLPELLLALEGVARGNLGLSDETGFKINFKTRGPALLDLCAKHWKPDSYLTPLFRTSTFSESEEELPAYITMLGK
jgi:predicted KAP-like P-loop ATPase